MRPPHGDADKRQAPQADGEHRRTGSARRRGAAQLPRDDRGDKAKRSSVDVTSHPIDGRLQAPKLFVHLSDRSVASAAKRMRGSSRPAFAESTRAA